MSALRGLVDLVFPPACQVCRAPGTFPLCADCRSVFRLIRPPLCQKCGKPLRGPPDLVFTCVLCRHRRLYFAASRAAGIYDGALREAIHALKFAGCQALAVPLGSMMADYVVADEQLRTAALVVPIPLHRRRLRERGFNQAEALAAEVAGRLKVSMGSDLLVRRQHTEAQSGLTFEDRRKNVRGAFAATQKIDAITILLVDDVISTGFTVSECARALRRAGAARVVVIAAAMAVLD